MPRISRIAFAGYPHHIYQRGHRQQDVFFCAADRQDYLRTLAECRDKFGLKVYAYCLMDNHVHLIIDPGPDAANLSLTLKRLAGRHARRVNLMRRWRGALWESRFKCSPIQTDRYLLTCGRYVDLNPVRARMVQRPDEYVWSSYRARAGLVSCDWLDRDPAIAGLASTYERSSSIYRQLAGSGHDEQELELIRGALHRNQLTGSEQFPTDIRDRTGVLVLSRKRGRPKKPGPST
jgi:putative transposase